MSDQTVYEFELVVKNNNFILRDHRVDNIRIMPGVTLLDIIYRLGRKALGHTKFVLEQVLFHQPIVTHESFDQKLRVAFALETEGRWRVQAQSQKVKAGRALAQAWSTIVQCTLLENVSLNQRERFDIATFIRCSDRQWNVDQMYELTRATNIWHGPFMKTSGTLYQRGNEEVMMLQVNGLAEEFRNKFYIHPALLDGATFAGSSFQLGSPNQTLMQATVPHIPFSIQRFCAYRALPQTIYVHSKFSLSSPTDQALPDVFFNDMTIYDESGDVLIKFERFTLKRLRDLDLINRLLKTDIPGEGNRDQPALAGSATKQPAKEKPAGTQFIALTDSQNATVYRSDPAPEQISPPLEEEHVQVAITTYLQEQIANIVDKAPVEIDTRTPFYELGLDSITLLKVTKALEEQCGHELYPTLLFEYATIEELTAYLSKDEADQFLGQAGARGSAEVPALPEVIEQRAASREELTPNQMVYYRPTWQRQDLAAPARSTQPSGEIVIVIAEAMREIGEQIAHHYPHQRVLRLIMGNQHTQYSATEYSTTEWMIDLADDNTLVETLAALPEIDTLYFLGCGSEGKFDPTDTSTIDERQEQGVISFFRLLKELDRQGLRQQSLALKIITVNAHQIHAADTSPQPWNATMCGVAMCLASEYPRLDVSCIDIDLQAQQTGRSSIDTRAIKAIIAETGSQGQPIALRNGGRYVRKLYPLHLPESRAVPYRQGGVYLILGGGNGIGLETGVYLAQEVQAKLVLVGRSVLTPARERQLQRIREVGGDYLYCQADGTSLVEMQRVVREAKETFGAINGVIHSALVLKDGLINTLDEATWRAVLAPKVTGSIVLYQAVKDENLDFMLFFSAALAFRGNIGQSNYAAGSTFMDAFALSLNQVCRFPVQVINWGYWDEVGVVAAESYRQLLAEQGVQPIRVAEGMRALTQMLAHPITQMVAIKGERSLLEAFGVAFDQQAVVSEPIPAALVAQTVQQIQALARTLTLDELILIQEQQGFAALEHFAQMALLRIVQQMGVLQQSGERYDQHDLVARLDIVPKYQQLYQAILTILQQAGYINVTATTIEVTPNVAQTQATEAGADQEWQTLAEQREAIRQTYPSLRPHLELLWRCLQALPTILQGKVPATNVLFPNGSMELVAAANHGTELSDYLSRITAFAIKHYVEERLPSLEVGQKVRIVEVGAGTGGTTASVLQALEPYGDSIDYVYTDLSHGFTDHGKTRFGTRYPFVRFGLLDIEKCPSDQGYDLSQAEIVLGANVVHATKEIHNTLQNLKALLKANGLLILQEITQFTAFTTLTFGLLDGWWLFVDGEQRIEHTPLLSPAQWDYGLRRTGFRQIHLEGQTNVDSITLGDQVAQTLIVAQSDGVVEIAKPIAHRTEHEEAHGAAQKLATLEPNRGNNPRLRTTPTPVVTKIAEEPTDIAIIGLSGRYPLAEDLTEFWKNLKEGRNCIREIPPARWDYRHYYDPEQGQVGKIYSKWGGFLDDIDKFDPLLFNISPREAERMDPQERLFLETVWATVEDAGYSRTALAKVQQVGVFVGVMNAGYSQLSNGVSTQSPVSYWSIANRVSYFFDWHGPSLAVDTACSSSLTAIHLACESLRRGECNLAIAGGVNLIVHPSQYIRLSAMNMLAQDDKVKAFGAGADGFVDGEGVGAVLLKPLVQARADRDQIYGVIKGSAINAGGRTSGYSVPNPKAQRDLIVNALARSGVEADTITYVEAHGTGTALGDPIEISGLRQAFGQAHSADHLCAIGSVKPNIGHLESAAGIAGLTKVLLQLKHQQLVPSLHAERRNPHIDFAATPFQIQQELASWHRPVINVDDEQRIYPRRAGISSFGAGGANAHLLVEEYVEADVGRREAEVGIGQVQLIVLSARTEEQLQAYVTKWLAFLTKPTISNQADLHAGQPETILALQKRVRAVVADLLEVDLTEVEIEQPFAEFGLDPVQLGSLQTVIEEHYGCKLALTHFSAQATVISVANALTTRECQSSCDDQIAMQPTQSLSSIAYTLQVGREAMQHRLALVVSTVEELVERLGQYNPGQSASDHIYHSDSKTSSKTTNLLLAGETGAQFLRSIIDNQELDKLAQLWVAGVAIDWSLLYPNDIPQRISLPTYPFAQERYWIPETTEDVSVTGQLDLLHPLVHKNTSTLTRQRFTSLFTGNEFFLRDHQVQGEKVLPGVAYLEMARAAGEMALEEAIVTQIRDVVWVRPLVVNDRPLAVDIGLYPHENGEIAFEVTSNGQAEPLVHSQGKLAVGELRRPEPLDIRALQARCTSTLTGTACYAFFAEHGFDYGSAFQGIAQLSYNDHEALAELRLPVPVATSGYGLHPSLLDATLQTIIGLALGQNKTEQLALRMPFGVQRVNMYGDVPAQGYAYVQVSNLHVTNQTSNNGLPPTRDAVNYDITLTDEQGTICVVLNGFAMRPQNIISQKSFVPLPPLKEGDKPFLEIYSTSHQHVDEQPHNGVLYGTPSWRAQSLAVSEEISDRASVATLLLLVGLKPDLVELMSEKFPQAQIINLDSTNVMTLIHQSWQQLQAIIKQPSNAQQQILVLAANSLEPHLYMPLAGLLKTARLEQPRIRGKVIILAQMDTSTLLSLVNRELAADTFQMVEVCYDEAGARTVKSIEEVALEASPQASQTYIKPGGVYWITGGMGGLGLIFARYLLDGSQLDRANANDENRTVILSGRSALDEVRQQHLAVLNQLPGTAVYLQADVSVQADVERVIEIIHEQYGGLDGIIHSAGVLRDSLIIHKTAGDIEAVLAPKMQGILNIDAATQREDLDFMVLFSSLSGVWGNIGQADYAAANAFLDAFAQSRQALVAAGERTGRTLSINWPLWAEGGMTVDGETATWMKREIGLAALDASAGLATFEAGLAQENVTQLLVTSGDMQKIRANIYALDQTRSKTNRQSTDLAIQTPTLTATGGTTTQKNDLFSVAAEYLKQLLAEALKLPAASIDPNASWERYGLDSVLALNVTRQLEESFGELPKTLFFEYLTLTELTNYFVDAYPTLLQETVEAPAQNADPTTALRPQRATITAPSVSLSHWLPNADETNATENNGVAIMGRLPEAASQPEDTAPTDIAIIGVGGRYPMAENLAEFWDNLKAGRNCITEMPADRWDHNGGEYNGYHAVETTNELDKSNRRWGGFIDDVDKFDPLLFNIAPHEAGQMDPQVRLFLETVWTTLEDAGYRRSALAKSQQVGVFVGTMSNHYPFVAHDINVAMALGSSSYWQIANRVSYFFDFQGPSLVIDTACSSSLTAIHLACESIKRDECQMAVAGGINLSLHPAKWAVLRQAQLLGSEGKSKSLGDGDGYVPGEGVGAVLLKRLDHAMADNDRIYAVIKGSAVNHGGRTASFTVPNPNVQADLIRQTFAKTGVDPQTISYIEVAANGSALGDPIEIAGLNRVFQSTILPTTNGESAHGLTPAHPTPTYPIGSVKSNIGHLEAASGISQLTKVILQLQHHTLVPSINADPINPHLGLEKTPFIIQKEVQTWRRPTIEQEGTLVEMPRRAAISSFGAGGSNAHLVVEEFRGSKANDRALANGPHLIVLSAQTKERLQAYAKLMLDAVQTRQSEGQVILLADLAYTLQIGREAMAERLAFVVHDYDELYQGLAVYSQNIDDAAHPIEFFRGNSVQSEQDARVLARGQAGQALLEQCLVQKDWAKLAFFWSKGLEIPWEQLYGVNCPQRVALPTYPFERKRYWLVDAGTNMGIDAGLDTAQSVNGFKATDVKAVEQPAITRRATVIPPRTPTEIALADIWSAVLGIEQLGNDDNFFELGGHSLLATRVVSRINAEFQIAFPLHCFFAAPTIAAVANEIDQQQMTQQADAQLRQDLQRPFANAKCQVEGHQVEEELLTRQQVEGKQVEGRL